MRDDKVCPQTARPLACRRCFYAGANRRSVIRPGKVSSTRRGVAGHGLSVPAKTACGFVRRVASFSAGRSHSNLSVQTNKNVSDAWVCCPCPAPHTHGPRVGRRDPRANFCGATRLAHRRAYQLPSISRYCTYARWDPQIYCFRALAGCRLAG